MNKFDCLNVFCQVARDESFTIAAMNLNTTQSSVSKKVAWLEHSLKLTLFHRTSRNVKLTEQGKQYFDYSSRLLEEMSVTESRLRDELTAVSGRLLLSSPSAFATMQLAEPIARFMESHPAVTVNVSVNDRFVDLYQTETDIAIRAKHLEDSNLKARKLLDHQAGIFATPDYVSTYGSPKVPEDLQLHRCLTYSLISPSNRWHLEGEKYEVNEVFSSDSPDMLLKMALLGNGITYLPKWMVQDYVNSGQLIELFSQLPKAILPMYAVYKSTEHTPYRIRAFIDFLADYFQQREAK